MRRILFASLGLVAAASCSVANTPDAPISPQSTGSGETGPGGSSGAGGADSQGGQSGECELNTLEHCGACDVPCEPENTQTPSCAAGECDYDMCQANFGDCDSERSNGCETAIDNDPLHCGQCDNDCANAGFENVSMAICTEGACDYDNCAATHGDCDNDQTNGCEQSLDDMNHCGGCGTLCDPMAVLNVDNATCTGGQCGYDMCTMAFGDCDNVIANGCETDTTNDTAHCGSCNNTCNGNDFCIGGNCIGVLKSCKELFDNGAKTSGPYTVDVDGAGPLKAKQVYCDMVNQGGGWTECVKVVNTAGEDLPCNVAGWLDSCVNATMATWSGNEVMVALYTANTTTYAAFGPRNNPWTYDNLTSTNGGSSQYDRSSHHMNAIILSDNRILTISGKNATNDGWGGSWGNGYVLAAQTQPSYASNNVLAVMSFNSSSPSSNCGARAFAGMDAGHEVMYSSTGKVSTHSNAALTNAYKYLNTFRFLVR